MKHATAANRFPHPNQAGDAPPQTAILGMVWEASEAQDHATVLRWESSLRHILDGDQVS